MIEAAIPTGTNLAFRRIERTTEAMKRSLEHFCVHNALFDLRKVDCVAGPLD